MADTSVSPAQISDFESRLDDTDLKSAFAAEEGTRQPVHTVYGGAHIFRSDSASRLGALARRSMEQWAPTADDLAVALGRERGDEVLAAVYDRVLEKLEREPVEDYRIDFEDGFGLRSDEEEDAAAEAAADEVVAGLERGTLPPFNGIRIKPFSPELRRRAFRTADLFVTRVSTRTGGALPEDFVITLPKVVSVSQASVLAEFLDALEDRVGVAQGSIRSEIMIETTQSIFDSEGHVNVARLVNAAGNRCRAVHFGAYDYTASCQITSSDQSMTHPACDFARHVMQVALAGSGVWMSDGATATMPVPIHRGESLSAAQAAENQVAVHGAWRRHFDETRHSLRHGFYQGWDLHPAQLVTRYAAVQSFFLEGMSESADRLRHFVDQAAQATLVGAHFDDAATGQGLLSFFARAVNSGAISSSEATRRTGVTIEELRGRNFARILENRSGGSTPTR